VVGRLRNNNYTDNEGADIYGFGFTCEEIDYLDSRAESDARRARQEGGPAPSEGDKPAPVKSSRNRRTGNTSANRELAPA